MSDFDTEELLENMELEERIIRSRVPEVDGRLRHQLVEFVHSLRQRDLKKVPAISETIDWARSLLLLHADQLDEELVRSTLNGLLKFTIKITLLRLVGGLQSIELIDIHLDLFLQTYHQGLFRSR